MFRFGAIALTLGLTTALALPATAHAADNLGFAGCNAKPSKADTAEAKRNYERGKKLYDDRDRGAIDLFRSAYLADCTKHELLVVLSFAYQSDGQLKEALAASQLYAQKRGKSLAGEDRRTVEERIAMLEAKVKEQEDAKATAAAAAAAPPPVAVEARPAPREAPPPAKSPLPWVLVGVGAASIVTGAILFPLGRAGTPEGCHGGGVFTNGECPRTGTPEEQDERAVDAGNAMGMQRAGIVMLAAGGAAVIGGVVWYAALGRPGPKSAGLQLVPSLSPRSIGLVGTF